jgi:hypothetical protein
MTAYGNGEFVSFFSYEGVIVTVDLSMVFLGEGVESFRCEVITPFYKFGISFS